MSLDGDPEAAAPGIAILPDHLLLRCLDLLDQDEL